MLTFIFFILFILFVNVSATNKCVWVRGAVLCQKDPSKQFNVEIRVIDRDGFSLLQTIDPDDLMGVTFSEPDGTFQLDGCGSDFNWLPGIPNLPDPYIKILHYCNSAKGETIELPEFSTFVPKTHDIGIIILDSRSTPNVPVTFPTMNKPRHGKIEHESNEKRDGGGHLSLSHLFKKEDLTSSNNYKNNSSSVLWDSSSIELIDSGSYENKTNVIEERRPNLTKAKFNKNVKPKNGGGGSVELLPDDAD